MRKYLALISTFVGLALFAQPAQADVFGPSDDTLIVTGFGYDPLNPTTAKQSPFISKAVEWETTGTAGFEYKMEYSRDLSASTREVYYGAELKAKVGFFSAASNVSVSSQISTYKSSYSLNLYARSEYGTEYIADETPFNLTAEANALRNDTAGWIAKYGTQVVTRRRRGAIVHGKITFNTTDTRRLSQWAAQFEASYGGAWSANLSGSVKSLMNEALSTLNASITVTGYGGQGISALNLRPEDGPTNEFQSYLNMINRYLTGVNRDNSAIIGYQTASYRQYLTQSQDPFAAPVADVYLRYISLKAKEEALTEVLADTATKIPWLNPDQIAALTSARDLCRTRKDQVWTYGRALVTNPKLVAGQTLPSDVDVKYPTLPNPRMSSPIVNASNNTYYFATLLFPGAHRLRGTFYYKYSGQWVSYGVTETAEGSKFETGLLISLWNVGDTFPFRIYDENNQLIQTGEFTIV
jgi:hypothetical protein